MRAVGYQQSLPIDQDASLMDVELPRPEPGPRDLLVEIKAVSLNPVDTKVRMRAQAEPGGVKVLGFDAAGIVRGVGKDVSLITHGGSLGKSLKAAEQLAAAGIDAEVVDLRVLRPLDTPAILASVAKTHRAVIIDEGWRTGSLAAEVSAQIMEGAFYELDAPVARVCSAEVPIPYAAHLEDEALPRVETIVNTVREMVGNHG